MRSLRLAVMALVLASGTALGACQGDGVEPSDPAPSSRSPVTTLSPDPTGPTDGPDEPAADPDEPSPQPPRPRDQVSVLDTVPGSSDAGCLAVDDQRDVRSGSMMAGPFDELSGPEQVRLYFVPARAGGDVALAVTARLVGGDEIVRWDQDRYSDAGGYLFYDTLSTLPAAGTWRIRARAGRATGCFVVDIA